MKMSTINVITIEYDIMTGPQPKTVARVVPASEINYPTNNKKIKSTQGHANKVIINHLYRPQKTKTIPTDTDVNTDKNHQTPKGNSEYTDSGQIISVCKTRESKKHAIQSARKNQRNQKLFLQNLFNQHESLTDFYEPDINAIVLDVPHKSLQQQFARLQKQAQRQRFIETFRSFYYPENVH